MTLAKEAGGPNKFPFIFWMYQVHRVQTEPCVDFVENMQGSSQFSHQGYLALEYKKAGLASAI
jgi:hypothetical protein